MTDEWRDYESIPSMAPFPDADGRGTWVEVPVQCRVKGTGSLRAWRLEPPPPEQMVRIVGTGSLVVQGGYAVVTADASE